MFPCLFFFIQIFLTEFGFSRRGARASLFLYLKGGKEMEEKVINEHVDGMLSELEVYFKESVEGKKPLQEELDAKVKGLMDEYDEKDEVKKFESVKAIVDYITLTLSMPIGDELKESVIEKLVKECEEKYGCKTNEEV